MRVLKIKYTHTKMSPEHRRGKEEAGGENMEGGRAVDRDGTEAAVSQHPENYSSNQNPSHRV
jgi:hypothetical protein